MGKVMPTNVFTVLDRRELLVGAGALALGIGANPRRAHAQAKIAPPHIIKAGTLVMSINPTLPPLQFVNDKGELQGMRVELGNEIAKWLGLTPEYVRIEFAAMVPGLASKRWDMINTGIFWTEERSKLMYMVPYEQAAISFLVTKGNPLNITKWQDLAGRAVSVELGGIEERRTREVDEMLKKEGLKGIEIRTFNNFAEVLPGPARSPSRRRDLDRRDRDVLAGARRLHPRRRRACFRRSQPSPSPTRRLRRRSLML